MTINAVSARRRPWAFAVLSPLIASGVAFAFEHHAYEVFWVVYVVLIILLARILVRMTSGVAGPQRASVLVAFGISAFVSPWPWIIVYGIYKFAHAPDRPLFL